MTERDEFGRQKIQPLEHPRDLFTPEEQADLNDALQRMSDQRKVKPFPDRERAVMPDQELSKQLQKTEKARERFFDSLTGLIEAVKPAIVAAVEDMMNDE